MSSNHHLRSRASLVLLCTGLTGQVHAASIAAWEGCSPIPADVERLACYDRVSGRSQPAVEPAFPASDHD